MAGQIRITPDTMRQRAQQYQTESDNVGQVIQNMVGLLGQLQTEWEGAASASYAQRFDELKPSFMQAQNLIHEISVALTNTAATLEETDQNIASGFQAR